MSHFPECSCGLAFTRGNADGVQRCPGEPGIELRTCSHCRNTIGWPLSSKAHIRQGQCEQLLVEVAGRDDLSGAERQRRLKLILEELRDAQAETRRASLSAVSEYRHA
jgi:hypothetical protein